MLLPKFGSDPVATLICPRGDSGEMSASEATAFISPGRLRPRPNGDASGARKGKEKKGRKEEDKKTYPNQYWYHKSHTNGNTTSGVSDGVKIRVALGCCSKSSFFFHYFDTCSRVRTTHH